MKKLLLALVLMAIVTPAMADDFAPPEYRGWPLSYTAEWDVFTNGTFGTGIYTDAESFTDDYDDPSTYLYNGFGTHIDFGPEGTWSLTPPEGGGFHNTTDATFQASVVNWVDLMPEKWLRIQVTFNDVLLNGPPVVTGVTGYSPVSGDGPHLSIPVASVPVDSTHFYEDWIIIPNPDWEAIEFFLPAGTIVEQLIIDTVSPEPASMSLLALGAVALLRRRRK